MAYKTQIPSWKIKLFLILSKKQVFFFFKQDEYSHVFKCLKISFLQNLPNLSSCDREDDTACVAYERADENFANEHL